MSQTIILALTYTNGWCAKALLRLKVVIMRLRCLSGMKTQNMHSINISPSFRI